MAKRKIFISIPMRGRTDDDIKKDMKSIMKEHYPDDELIDSVIDSGTPVKCLANSINLMSDADIVAFAPGWEKARGCKIELQICKDYDIPYQFVLDEGVFIQTENGDYYKKEK